MKSVEMLREMIAASQYIVFFGGAGVSTESGIPDFRSEAGHFAAIRRFGEPPETLLSRAYFMARPEKFYEYYKSALLVADVGPNRAHLALAKLEERGKLRAVVTQNIDGLHQAAGSRCVYELHGGISRNFCMACGREYGAAQIKNSPGVPRCACGGVVKPDVVLYGEGLDQEVLRGATAHIGKADMLIVGGTSLVVYPAAGLVNYFRGSRLALINQSETPYDYRADLVVRAPVGEVLGEAVGV
ncbi:MAG: NAD-dependent protein deacetylase [Firmicutes bacterium ADurb.Bin248]|nr:MAG: NAD-dependent protein deacetylase [Firmicutes bacterium ADurb.Bin248]HOF99471.1 NAD-dependent protein deacylase [Clostridia bacterium]